MHTDFLALEQKLQREKRLLDAEVMIDVLARVLVSKGIITEAELASETAIVKSTEKYDFDVHETEVAAKVFSAMLDTCLKEETRLYGLPNEDGTFKKEDA